MCTLPQGVHPKTTAPCTATPECIMSYYDVRSPGQYTNNNVPSCVATTLVQSNNYPGIPSSWPKQKLFDDHSNVSYIKKKQSPVYGKLATKNWTVVTTTWSYTQSTPIGQRAIVDRDMQERSIVYTPYPRSDPCVYAVSERERDKY